MRSVRVTARSMGCYLLRPQYTYRAYKETAILFSVSSQSDAFYARCPPLYRFARHQVIAEVIALIKSSARCFYLILPVLHILSSIEGCLKNKKSIPPNILRFWQIKYFVYSSFSYSQFSQLNDSQPLQYGGSYSSNGSPSVHQLIPAHHP